MGEEAAKRPARDPSTISALVPTSIRSWSVSDPVWALGEDCGCGVGPDVAGDTGADVHRGVGIGEVELAGVDGDRIGGGEHERCRSQAVSGRSRAEMVHHRIADQRDRTTSCRGGRRPALSSSAISSVSADRTAVVSSTRPPGFIITKLTRLIRSSPNRICGFIRPAEASTLTGGEIERGGRRSWWIRRRWRSRRWCHEEPVPDRNDGPGGPSRWTPPRSRRDRRRRWRRG